MAIKTIFELCMRKSNKSLYSVWCMHDSCKWAIFKINKFVVDQTCSIEVLDHDRRQTSTFVIRLLRKNLEWVNQ